MPSPDPATVPWSATLLRGHLIAAHACLLAAVAWMAVRPEAVLASAMHPDVLACVHLVTLGCVTTACLGAFHVVLPLTMRTAVRATAWDWSLLAITQLVAAGVAAHMWLQTYGGVGWSALLLLFALLVQLGRYARPVWRANAPRAMKLGCALAGVNLLAVVALGGGLAVHRSHPWLPHGWLQAITAHVHLALLGFVGTLLAAVGLRLLPMFLPAKPPPAWLATTAVLGLGVGGLACGVGALQGGWLHVGRALLLVGALAWFAGWLSMLRRRLPAPAHLPRRLPAHLLMATGVASAAAAAAIGTCLWAGALTTPAWPLYGSLLLLGVFVSFVLGVGQRLLPLAERLRTGHGDPHRLPGPWLPWLAAGAWTTGIAVLAVSLHLASAAGVRTSMSLLAVAASAGLLLMLRRRAPSAHLVSSARR
jgi:hypothetical protein